MFADLFRGTLYVAAAASVAAWSTASLALDEVVRRSGESARGNVTAVSKTEVKVEAVGRSEVVPASDIAAIRWDGEPPQLNLTRSRETNGDLDFALKSYRDLLGEVGDKPNIKADLEFSIARTLAKQAIGNPAQKDAAVKPLEAYLSAHPDFYRYYDALSWLGRVNTAAGDAPAAKSAYDRLAQAPLPELQMAAENAVGRIDLDQGDLTAALTAFEAIIAKSGDTPATARERFRGQLGKAAVLQRQNKPDAALAVLTEVIDKAAPTDTAVQAEAFLRKGDSLQGLGRDKDALLAYLHVDVLFPTEAEAHAEALYHLTQLWNAVGRADRSADARRKLTEQYGGTAWAKKLTGPA